MLESLYERMNVLLKYSLHFMLYCYSYYLFIFIINLLLLFIYSYYLFIIIIYLLLLFIFSYYLFIFIIYLFLLFIYSYYSFIFIIFSVYFSFSPIIIFIVIDA